MTTPPPSSMLPPERSRPGERSFLDTGLRLSGANPKTSVKKRKTLSHLDLKPGHHKSGSFWDSLSRIHLDRSALRELNRRLQVLTPQHTFEEIAEVKFNRLARSKAVQKFSRNGGPDLTDLRGFKITATSSPLSVTSRERRSSTKSERSRSGSTSLTSTTEMDRKLSPYSPNFRQKLIDSHIYPEDHEYEDGTRRPPPANLEAIHQRLNIRRASLSPSHFTQGMFADFKVNSNRATNEASTVHRIAPIISGNTDKRYRTEWNRQLNNLEPFDEYISAPQPDSYDGSVPSSIPLQIRKDLHKFITPCNNDSLPAVPNFFSEWKGPAGRSDVATVQATYDGTVGTRAMHKLQNYGQRNERYDNNARSFSSIYFPKGKNLELYAHHVTAPEALGDIPDYHMTQLHGYNMTSTAQEFREGATAFRNLRDLSAEMRGETIAVASSMLEQQAQSPVIQKGWRHP